MFLIDQLASALPWGPSQPQRILSVLINSSIYNLFNMAVFLFHVRECMIPQTV